MRVFDELIANTDRNQGNMLIDKQWKLWLIDHTRGFRTTSDRCVSRRSSAVASGSCWRR